MSLRVRPYFVNRLWTRCAASVRASFARDIGRTVASKTRSYKKISAKLMPMRFIIPIPYCLNRGLCGFTGLRGLCQSTPQVALAAEGNLKFQSQ